MQSTAVHLALLASFVGLTIAAEKRNCSDPSTIPCYTCMGRDMTNCNYGLVCCKGSCYKLIDTEHNLIVKGCTTDQEEDASMKRRTLDVVLYWTAGEKISGESYFCNSNPEEEYCNGISALSTVSSLIVLLLLFLFH